MTTVAFQGERGAYSEAAALEYFDKSINAQPCDSFDKVFETVVQGEADLGIVPVENTLAGSIHNNYDLLERYHVQIVGEKIFHVSHCLIAQPGVDKKDIKKVISHPQALAQCEAYLDKLGVAREPWYDTAGSVKHLKSVDDKSMAGIASSCAAKVYGMQILDKGIETDALNYTRFLVLAQKAKTPKTDKVKTSVVFSLPRGDKEAGCLFKAMGVFALRDINLTKIESRPIPGKSFQYWFYLDFEGSPSEMRCQRALEQLEAMCVEMRILGTYDADARYL